MARTSAKAESDLGEVSDLPIVEGENFVAGADFFLETALDSFIRRSCFKANASFVLLCH